MLEPTNRHFAAIPSGVGEVDAVFLTPLQYVLDATYSFYGSFGVDPSGAEAEEGARARASLRNQAFTLRAFIGPAFFSGGKRQDQRTPMAGGGYQITPLAPIADDADDALEIVIGRLDASDQRERQEATDRLFEAVRHITGDLERQLNATRASAFEISLRDPARWREFQQIRRCTGQGLAKSLPYWRQLYRGIAEILKADRPPEALHWYLLTPQERDHWHGIRGRDVTAGQAAAFIVWDRAGRPGRGSTFIQRLGNRIPTVDLPTYMTPAPLTDAYRWEPEG